MATSFSSNVILLDDLHDTELVERIIMKYFMNAFSAFQLSNISICVHFIFSNILQLFKLSFRILKMIPLVHHSIIAMKEILPILFLGSMVFLHWLQKKWKFHNYSWKKGYLTLWPWVLFFPLTKLFSPLSVSSFRDLMKSSSLDDYNEANSPLL